MTRIGTDVTAMSDLPAWMMVSSVYVKRETTFIRSAASRLYARNPDVVSGTSVSDAWRTTHEPQRCSSFFDDRELGVVRHLAVADHHVGPVLENRRDQLRDVVGAVLVVGVGVDDHVGAELQRGVEAGLERDGEALVLREAHDVVDAVGAGDLDGAVGRSVVDDQPLDLVEPVDLARELGERHRQRRLLVEAGDLDDQLHAALGV